jgi:hypothetical protein
MNRYNTRHIDEEILLYALMADSNGFREVVEDENIIRVGRQYFDDLEYIDTWLNNGRRAMKKLQVERFR